MLTKSWRGIWLGAYVSKQYKIYVVFLHRNAPIFANKTLQVNGLEVIFKSYKYNKPASIKELAVSNMTTTRHITKLILSLAILALTSCNGHTTIEKLYLKDFKFDGYFGNMKGDKNTTYCLLGQGYFRTPHSKNSDSLLSSWLTKHANAIVVKISSLATPEKSNPNLNLTYCWIIDGNDTLNNYLIRQGCYPGGTMQRPKTWDEMSRNEKELYEDTDKSTVTVHIDKKTYDTFIEQIKSAEIYARDNKFGIWAKADNEE